MLCPYSAPYDPYKPYNRSLNQKAFKAECDKEVVINYLTAIVCLFVIIFYGLNNFRSRKWVFGKKSLKFITTSLIYSALNAY